MKTISDPSGYVQPVAEEYVALYGKDIVSIVLYGSAAGGDFHPQRSDINLLIVVSDMSPELIARSEPLQKKYERQRVARPLFMDTAYIAASVDSYPMEFLDMKGCYRVLYGEDVLAQVKVSIGDLRLQVERELKGKWLHLLQEFSSARVSRKRMEQLIGISLKAFSPVFRGLLTLKEKPVPHKRDDLFDAVEMAYGLDGQPLQQVAAAAAGGSSGQELEKKYIAYAGAIKKLIDAIENN
ncbi:MAG: nucleotidyltransferase domain-containing protein [Chitinispirillaceae bacterium]|nr:nucleotidyltransferase domain-containing protein [Chitinispirillaceae bacterium]